MGSFFQAICGLLLICFSDEKFDYGFKNKETEDAFQDSSINISDSMTAAVTPDTAYDWLWNSIKFKIKFRLALFGYLIILLFYNKSF